MHRRVYVALAVLIAVAYAAPAAAAANTPTVDDAVRIAAQAWPESPCDGRLHVTYDDTLAALGHLGKAPPHSCEILLNPVLDDDPLRRCDVIVHEAGHHAGRQHEAWGVMSPTAGHWPGCRPLGLTVRRRIRSHLPQPRVAWSIACAEAPGTMSCVARSAHAVRHRSFRVTIYSWDDFVVRPAVRRGRATRARTRRCPCRRLPAR